MSVRVMAWVFEHSQTLWGERLVALALADSADDLGKCWPAIQIVADKARVSRATVKRATRHMVELGELQMTDRGRQTNVYQFTCRLSMSPQDAPTIELVGSNRTVVGSNGVGCGLTHDPQNRKEPSRTIMRAATATRWPDGFELTDERTANATRLGCDPKWEWQKFRDHHQAKGSRFMNWDAAWRTWLRNAVDFELQRRRS